MTELMDQMSLTDPITDEGIPTQTMRTFITQVTESGLIIGNGSPEGVVEANQGREYMDKAGTASVIKYIKRDPDDGLGDKSIGWILS